MSYIKKIKKHNIQVTPVVDNNGEVLRWVAGIRVYSPGGNYTPNDKVAKGHSLEEAIDNLLAGRTIIKTDGAYSDLLHKDEKVIDCVLEYKEDPATGDVRIVQI